MLRVDLCNCLRTQVRERLSPTPTERTIASNVYAAIQAALAPAKCRQIGSFPRFTAVSPIHDLDILINLGPQTERLDPTASLDQVEHQLRTRFENPTDYQHSFGRQSHSVSIEFMDGRFTVFGVDVVPAFAAGKNNFGDDTFVVPEIAESRRPRRKAVYESIAAAHRPMAWLRSDPLGYISVASKTNAQNPDFRKAVKIAKAWRWQWKRTRDEFPLKSFHIEQVITSDFATGGPADVFDGVYRFFRALPDLILHPQIPDRADPSRNIDAYVADMTPAQRSLVVSARDHFLIMLEDVENAADIPRLFEPGQRRRTSSEESYLFDDGIPMFPAEPIAIRATALARAGGFRPFVLSATGKIPIDRQIEFRLAGSQPRNTRLKWKVKNDDTSPQPRGEITNDRTRNDPENTKYPGRHYVEVYAIRNGECVARARQPVVLERH